MPPENGTVAIKNVLSIIASIAGILAIYSGFMWFAFSLKIDGIRETMEYGQTQMTAQMSNFSQSIDSLNTWRTDKSEEISRQGEKIKSLDGRISSVEAKEKLSVDKRR